MLRIGLISDTHGLLRPEVLEFLRGCDFIVHGGDVGDADILKQLSLIAPLTAVRGNNDRGARAGQLANDAFLRAGDILIHVIHDLALLQIDPQTAGVRVVISGHSHVPAVRERDGVLFVNPGSCGPRRFKLPVAVGELRVDGNAVTARTIALELHKHRIT